MSRHKTEQKILFNSIYTEIWAEDLIAAEGDLVYYLEFRSIRNVQDLVTAQALKVSASLWLTLRERKSSDLTLLEANFLAAYDDLFRQLAFETWEREENHG